MRWRVVYIQYDGTSTSNKISEHSVNRQRDVDDGYWKTILNLPELVVVAWMKHHGPTYNQYRIYVKTDG